MGNAIIIMAENKYIYINWQGTVYGNLNIFPPPDIHGKTVRVLKKFSKFAKNLKGRRQK